MPEKETGQMRRGSIFEFLHPWPCNGPASLLHCLLSRGSGSQMRSRVLPSQVCQARGHAVLIQTGGHICQCVPDLRLGLLISPPSGQEQKFPCPTTPPQAGVLGFRPEPLLLPPTPPPKEVSKELRCPCSGPPQVDLAL